VTEQQEPAQSREDARDWAGDEAEALRIQREREAELLRRQQERE